MTLSTDLVSQFAKLTVGDKKKKTESIVYGTVVEQNGVKCVKIDGSELVTPVQSTTNIKVGERVTVMIKNHTATITGNLSSPAARTGDVEDLEASLEGQIAASSESAKKLSQILATSLGFFETFEVDSEGAIIEYMHDRPTLDESTVIWKKTGSAVGVSTDGGETWNAAIDADGNATVNILSAVGLSADWMHTGTLVVRDDEGNVMLSISMVTGEVSMNIPHENGTLQSLINSDTYKTVYINSEGREVSGLKFDFENGKFIFNGGGHFGGSLNVNNKFIVDAYGNAQIFGGRYYAMDEDGTISGYTTMDKNGFNVYDSHGIPVIKIGFPDGNSSYPYVHLNSGEMTSEESGIVKKFANGLWIGNYAPADEYGEFIAQADYNGIFISFSDSKTYVVNGTDMQNVYTGESIARFG